MSKKFPKTSQISSGSCTKRHTEVEPHMTCQRPWGFWLLASSFCASFYGRSKKNWTHWWWLRNIRNILNVPLKKKKKHGHRPESLRHLAGLGRSAVAWRPKGFRFQRQHSWRFTTPSGSCGGANPRTQQWRNSCGRVLFCEKMEVEMSAKTRLAKPGTSSGTGAM